MKKETILEIIIAIIMLIIFAGIIMYVDNIGLALILCGCISLFILGILYI